GAMLARVLPLLVSGGEGGLVRRGHGDLHLGNVALIDGEPVAFDAIEFDPVIASGDVLYDLAFLIMDLIERGFGAAANIVLNRYLLETRRPEDLDALAALPQFLSLRAAIRAMVTAEHAYRGAQRDGHVVRPRLRPDGAAAAAPRRGRWLVGYRQVGAGARARAGIAAGPGRRGAALRCGTQGALRRR